MITDLPKQRRKERSPVKRYMASILRVSQVEMQPGWFGPWKAEQVIKVNNKGGWDGIWRRNTRITARAVDY